MYGFLLHHQANQPHPGLVTSLPLHIAGDFAKRLTASALMLAKWVERWVSTGLARGPPWTGATHWSDTHVCLRTLCCCCVSCRSNIHLPARREAPALNKWTTVIIWSYLQHLIPQSASLVLWPIAGIIFLTKVRICKCSNLHTSCPVRFYAKNCKVYISGYTRKLDYIPLSLRGAQNFWRTMDSLPRHIHLSMRMNENESLMFAGLAVAIFGFLPNGRHPLSISGNFIEGERSLVFTGLSI